MKKIILSLVTLFSISIYAIIPADTHLGCQLYTGEPSVFYDLRKFSISKANQIGVRVITDFDGREGFCYNTEPRDAIECKYTNSDGKKIIVYLNDLSSSEIEGIVFYDGFLWDSDHKVSCDLLTF